MIEELSAIFLKWFGQFQSFWKKLNPVFIGIFVIWWIWINMGVIPELWTEISEDPENYWVITQVVIVAFQAAFYYIWVGMVAFYIAFGLHWVCSMAIAGLYAVILSGFDFIPFVFRHVRIVVVHD